MLTPNDFTNVWFFGSANSLTMPFYLLTDGDWLLLQW